MIVDRENFENCLSRFHSWGHYGVDTETFGLRWWENDGLFSIILADEIDSFYFNFLDKPDHLGNYAPHKHTLPWEWLPEFQRAFENPKSTWFAHNAKFDLGMLAREGLCLGGIVHCTEAVARLLHSQHYSYTLKVCMERMNGEKKSDAVDDYIKKHKLYNEIKIPGKAKAFKNKQFSQVPFEIMAPYGVIDGKAVRQLGQYQRDLLNNNLRHKEPKIVHVAIGERKLTNALYRMEKSGMKLDKEYTENRIRIESGEVDGLKIEYKGYTGKEFSDSNVQFAEYFTGEGVPFPLSEKGNPSFDKNVLADMDHPLAQIILDIRSASKRINSYYTNFVHYTSSVDGCVHPSIKQAGTQTGRMSIRDPALQTIPTLKVDIDDDEGDTFTAGLVRRCFVPPKDHCLFLPDYDQMEYRMMVDQAEELSLIEAINAGLDVHTATAELVGCERKAAKTINFLLLYGGGVQKLADALGIPFSQAKALRARYFMKLPKVKQWIWKRIKMCEIKGYTVNWAGRICMVPKKFAYKAPNYEIQGGSADLVKQVMVKCDDLVSDKVSTMNLQIHDELMFNLHKDELHLAPIIVSMMENTYPSKHLKLTAGPGYSWSSWGEKEDGYPTRNLFKAESFQEVGQA